MRLHFKNLILISLFFIFLYTVPIYSESQMEIKVQTDSLKSLIIPPKETSIEQIDKVYGQHAKSESCGKVPCNDSSKVKFTLYKWQLLEPREKQSFRAFLYVKFRNNEYLYSGINHICVGKNRKKCTKDSECWKNQQIQIKREEKSVLKDLKDISSKYEKSLKLASWNKK